MSSVSGSYLPCGPQPIACTVARKSSPKPIKVGNATQSVFGIGAYQLAVNPGSGGSGGSGGSSGYINQDYGTNDVASARSLFASSKYVSEVACF